MGDYVVVKWPIKNTNSYNKYIGLITEIMEDSSFNINFMRKKVGIKHTYFIFPQVKDASTVTYDDIIKKIGNPTIKRSHYTFPSTFATDDIY